MKFVVLLSGLMFLSTAHSTETEKAYEWVTDLDLMFQLDDTPDTVETFNDQGMEFTHYFYSSLNHSFLVNIETGEVCHAYIGPERKSCYPCGENEVSDVCP